MSKILKAIALIEQECDECDHGEGIHTPTIRKQLGIILEEYHNLPVHRPAERGRAGKTVRNSRANCGPDHDDTDADGNCLGCGYNSLRDDL